MLCEKRQHGCFAAGNGGIECGKEGSGTEGLTVLPKKYKPIVLTEDMDKAWMDLIYELPLPGEWRAEKAGDREKEEIEVVVSE